MKSFIEQKLILQQNVKVIPKGVILVTVHHRQLILSLISHGENISKARKIR